MPQYPNRLDPGMLAAVIAMSVSATAAVAAPGVPETRSLANGMPVVVLEDHTLPLVSVSLWVHAGSKDEIETSAGYAHFLEHLVQRGTDTAGPFEYQRLAHRWGGAVSVRANYDRTSITAAEVNSIIQRGIAQANRTRAAIRLPLDSSTRMVLAGFACLVHGLLPFLFVRTGSQTIAELNERMIANRPLPLHPIASDKRLPL